MTTNTTSRLEFYIADDAEESDPDASLDITGDLDHLKQLVSVHISIAADDIAYTLIEDDMYRVSRISDDADLGVAYITEVQA